MCDLYGLYANASLYFDLSTPSLGHSDQLIYCRAITGLPPGYCICLWIIGGVRNIVIHIIAKCAGLIIAFGTLSLTPAICCAPRNPAILSSTPPPSLENLVRQLDLLAYCNAHQPLQRVRRLASVRGSSEVSSGEGTSTALIISFS